jgi:uncharacterized protein
VMESFQKPDVKSNWRRILIYLILCIISTVIFFVILVMPFSEDWGSGSREAFNGYSWTAFGNSLATTLGIVAATLYVVKQIEHRPIASYRLTFNLRNFILGFSVGIFIMLLFVLCAFAFGIIDFSYQGFSNRLGFSFVFYAFVAISEEVSVRGYILTNLQEKMNPFWALLVSSLFFGALHVGNDYFTWIGFATISLSGFLMGLLVLRTGSISSAIGLHWSWNFVQGPILGFGVSGRQEVGLFSNASLRSQMFTGGEFGVEGSIVLCLITVTVIFFTYRFYSKQKANTISIIESTHP